MCQLLTIPLPYGWGTLWIQREVKILSTTQRTVDLRYPSLYSKQRVINPQQYNCCLTVSSKTFGNGNTKGMDTIPNGSVPYCLPLQVPNSPLPSRVRIEGSTSPPTRLRYNPGSPSSGQNTIKWPQGHSFNYLSISKVSYFIFYELQNQFLALAVKENQYF